MVVGVESCCCTLRLQHFSERNVKHDKDCGCFLQKFDAVIEALEKGQAVDLSGLPPSPGQGEEQNKRYLVFSEQIQSLN